MQAIHDFYVARNAIVVGDVVFAAGVNIWFNSVLRGDLATLTLGPRVNIQDGCIAHTDFGCPMLIEEGVVVGHCVMLHGRRIGRDSLIGIGARLLAGCDIGEECLIAAGAVVTEGKQIPPRSLVMGIPGKIVRTVTEEEVRRTRDIAAHYLTMAQRHAAGEFPPPWQRTDP
jgi:carbonic anhydrase/acetyltransferase-like protein (isoleucine patch superfamily)